MEYVNIMSKISKEAAMELDRICKEKGFRSKYELLQYLVTSFLRVNTNRCNEEEKILLNNLFSSKEISDYVRPGHRKKKRSNLHNEDIIMICNGKAYQIQECGCLNVIQVSPDKLIDNICLMFPELGFLMKGFGRCNKRNLIFNALKSYNDNHIKDDIVDEFRLYNDTEQSTYTQQFKRKKRKYVE